MSDLWSPRGKKDREVGVGGARMKHWDTALACGVWCVSLCGGDRERAFKANGEGSGYVIGSKCLGLASLNLLNVNTHPFRARRSLPSSPKAS